MMKKMIIFKLLILVCIVLSNGSCKKSKVLPEGNKIPEVIIPEIPENQEQIPTMAFVGVIESQTTITRYQELRNSGITHSYSVVSSAESMQKALDVAYKTGVKMFVSCPELYTDPEGIVKRFMKHPALAGYYLGDEPSRNKFSKIGELTRRIKAIDSEHILYVNVFPNYASEVSLGVNTYLEYIQTFIREVPVNLLSFDHYPVIGDTNLSIRSEWYQNLETFSDESRKANKPFWAFALTVAHDVYPIPALAALRLQVYSNLAYGAQGIQYFTYWTIHDPGGIDFNNAPITIDGRRTNVYDLMKIVNEEIKNLSKVFLGAKLVSVAHTGTNIPIGTKRLTELPKSIKNLNSEGMGAVVAVLDKGIDSYLVVVNRDLTGTLKLTIGCNPGVERILKDGSSVAAKELETLTVDPGDVTIYKLVK